MDGMGDSVDTLSRSHTGTLSQTTHSVMHRAHTAGTSNYDEGRSQAGKSARSARTRGDEKKQLRKM